MSKEIKIKQERTFDFKFESEEAFDDYIDEIKNQVSEERIQNIIRLKESQNG